MKIAIDGPSGSGKSTLAKALAAKLGLTYVDTGALYRTVGLYSRNAGIALSDIRDTVKYLDKITVEMKYCDGEQRVYLNGDDVSSLIRTGEISMYASAVSAIPEVRSFLLGLQKDMVDRGNVIMDGRDIGTVIMPDADVKIFLQSSPAARAHRRYLELLEKGEKCTEEEVLADIEKRDLNDKNREIAPAIPAEDAVFLDNSDIDIEGTVNAALKIISEKISL